MSKLIKFSQKFPKGHINEGEPTYFVQKILRGLGVDPCTPDYLAKLIRLNHKNIDLGKLTRDDIIKFHDTLFDYPIDVRTKFHTIRSGTRFKEGEMFTPTVWSGVAYKSPQIIFWDDLIKY